MSILAKARRGAAEFMYSRLRHAQHLEARIRELQDTVKSITAESDNHRNTFNSSLSTWMVQHRKYDMPKILGTTVQNPKKISPQLAARIGRAYKYSITVGKELTPDSMWSGISNMKRREHEILLSEDSKEICDLFDNPASHDLFYGFDALTSSEGALPIHMLNWRASFYYDNLLRLAEAVGATRIENPEVGPRSKYPSAEEIVTTLETRLGCSINFPNPLNGEFGIQTSRGVAGQRSVLSLYHANRISNLLNDKKEPSVLEIGAGLGRVAFYLDKMSSAKVTIVDIPLTMAAQAFFLGQTLGEDRISLPGENTKAQITLQTPNDFSEDDATFDLAANFDSLTEMSFPIATGYVEQIRRKSPIFLSSNHEHNSFTVSDIVGKPDQRMSCWLRRGYAEEVFSF